MSTIDHRPLSDSSAVASDSNPCFDMIGGRLERVASIGPDGSVLFRTSMAPGQVVPLHSHVDPECFYILTGCLEVFLLDASAQWRLLPSGRSILVADGVKHAIRNTARVAADIMVMTNARLAAFFRESGRPATPGSDFRPAGPEDIDRVVRTSEAYGYWMSSPAEHAAITGQSPPLGT